MVAGDRQRIDDDAAIDADHRQHDAEQQAQAEAGQQEPEEVVADIAVGKIHRAASRIAPRSAPFLQRGAHSADDIGVFGETVPDLQPRILGAIAEGDEPAIQAPVLDAPHLAPGAVKAGDRRLRHQPRLG